jgi:hypothetical protein
MQPLGKLSQYFKILFYPRHFRYKIKEKKNSPNNSALAFTFSCFAGQVFEESSFSLDFLFLFLTYVFFRLDLTFCFSPPKRTPISKKSLLNLNL